MLSRTGILLCCICISCFAAKEKLSQDITSYCLSIYTLQEAHFSETGVYAPSIQKLGGGAQDLPKRVHGYVPHFFGESSGYRLSLTNAGHDTLVFGSSGSLMRNNTVLYTVPHPVQMQAADKQPIVATITYKTDTARPIPIGNSSFRLVRTRATVSAKVNWPEGIAEYQVLDEKDSVQWKEKFKVSVSDEGIESPYANMGAAAVTGPKGKGFLLYFNMDSTSLTNMVTCRYFTLESGFLHPLGKPISFRGRIAGFRESNDTLKLDAKGKVTFAIWNGRFPTLASFHLDLAGADKGKPAFRLANPGMEQGYAVFEAGERQTVKPDAGEAFSFYTSLNPEYAETRKVPDASNFNVGRVFVKIRPAKLSNPEAVLEALDLESQAKTFVEVTLGKTRGWVNITQIRLFGFPEAG